MNQATVDRALRALTEINAAPSMPLERIPRMPDGVQLVRWEPKPAPVLLSRVTVVNNVPEFIRITLAELDRALHSEPETLAQGEVRELVDRLEQCGVVVKVQGIVSPSGGER